MGTEPLPFAGLGTGGAGADGLSHSRESRPMHAASRALGFDLVQDPDFGQQDQAVSDSRVSGP